MIVYSNIYSFLDIDDSYLLTNYSYMKIDSFNLNSSKMTKVITIHSNISLTLDCSFLSLWFLSDSFKKIYHFDPNSSNKRKI